MSSRKSRNKVAVITIGRWQPPHKGHDILIRDTIQKSIDLKGDPFVWISPSNIDLAGYQPIDISKSIQLNSSDPLTACQRLYYLNRMYPKQKYPKIKFLTDIDEPITLKLSKELNTGRSTFQTRSRGDKLPQNWQNMTLCEKNKYLKLTSNNDFFNRSLLVRNRSAGYIPGSGDKLPSAQCLHWLKSKGYTNVHLMVGSDRIAAFKKYNQALGDNLFKKFDIVQSGFDRGAAGKQELKESNLPVMIKSDSINEDISELMEGLSISPYEKKKRAEEFSGTRTRYYANNGDIKNFLIAIKEGNMTILDCFCLCNDIRMASSITPISHSDFTSQLTPHEVSEFNSEKSFIKYETEGRRRVAGLEPNWGLQTEKEDEVFGEQFNPFVDSDIYIGGKKRKKRTKKKNLKRNKKKTHRKTKKKRKTRKKRYKRKKKTRRYRKR